MSHGNVHVEPVPEDYATSRRASPDVARMMMLVVFLTSTIAAMVAGIVRFLVSHALPDALLFGAGALLAVATLLVTVFGKLGYFQR